MNKKIIGTTTVVPFYAGVAQLVEQLIRNAVQGYEKVPAMPLSINTRRVLILLKMNIC